MKITEEVFIVDGRDEDYHYSFKTKEGRSAHVLADVSVLEILKKGLEATFGEDCEVDSHYVNILDE